MQRLTNPRKLVGLAVLVVASFLAPACADRSPTNVNPRFALAIVPTAWNVGDVFAGVGNGKYNVYDNAGNFKETIDQGLGGFTTGCSFNPNLDRLYTTGFTSSRVIAFADAVPHSIVQTITETVPVPESIVFDTLGNFYVGHAGGGPAIQKYNAAGNPLTTFNAQVGPRGTDWVELAADQRTLFYTSEGGLIRRFDVAANAQLANFVDIGGVSFAFRLLPPGDGSGGMLVAHNFDVVRLSGSGSIVKTYDVAGEDSWFSLNLDPDGTSFWAGGIATGKIYKFDIATGAVLVTLTTGAPGTLFGICVKGEITASVPTDRTPPVCMLANRGVDGSGHTFIQVAARDEQSGLASVVVTLNNNAGVPVPPFTVGSTSTLLITATKSDETRSSQIELRVTDVAGNVTVCDPVDATLGSGSRWGNLKILSNIPQAEGKLSISNGAPGLSSLVVVVNGTRFEATALRGGEVRTLDIASAMRAGDANTIVLRAMGPKGASANVLIWDGVGDLLPAAQKGRAGMLSIAN